MGVIYMYGQYDRDRQRKLEKGLIQITGQKVWTFCILLLWMYLRRKQVGKSEMKRKRSQKLRGQEKRRRDRQRKDIDFQLKEAISTSQKLQGLTLCMCLWVCVVCMFYHGITASSRSYTHMSTHKNTLKKGEMADCSIYKNAIWVYNKINLCFSSEHISIL